MSSNVKWAGLLPELETADGLVPLDDLVQPNDRNRCEAVFGKACRSVRAVVDGIKATARVIERCLTTFAVLEILGVVLLMIFLQL